MSQVASTLMNLQPQVSTTSLAGVNSGSNKVMQGAAKSAGTSEFQVLQTLLSLQSGEIKTSDLPQNWINQNSETIAKIASDPQLAKTFASQLAGQSEEVTQELSSFQSPGQKQLVSSLDGGLQQTPVENLAERSDPVKEKNPLLAMFDRPGKETKQPVVKTEISTLRQSMRTTLLF